MSAGKNRPAQKPGRAAAGSSFRLWSPAAARQSRTDTSGSGDAPGSRQGSGPANVESCNSLFRHKGMLAGLAPVRASAGAAGGQGPVRPSQSSGHPGPGCLTAFFVCCPSDYRARSGPIQPLLRRGLRPAQSAPALLRRLFPLADCTSLALRVDRASVGHSYASFASRQKTTGGEGKLTGHQPHPAHQILSKGRKP
jgi:hypothetical protein